MNFKFSNCFDGVEGSEIRKIFALLSDPQIISFAGGNPSPRLFPTEQLASIAQDVIREHSASVLQYGNTPGMALLLDTLRKLNAPIMREDDDLITLTGSSQGLMFFAMTMLNRGDHILVEAPSFIGALQTYKIAGAQMHTVTLESDGVNIAELEEKIKQYAPKFFYVIPTFQNPTGVTTSPQKRKQIYEICKRYGVMILEDDPYAELRYEGTPVDSIKSLDDCGIVCKLSSFSKTISPGLRVGYAVAHKEVIARFNLLKQGADVHTSNLSQQCVYEFLQRGYYRPHVEMLCNEYKVQRDCMMQAIAAYFPDCVRITRPEGGLFLWATLPEGTDARRIFTKCVEDKVAFVSGAPFYAEHPHQNTLRMNFSMPTPENIEIGVQRMGKVLKQEI